ncbi:MAG: DUF4157 domain-containing protein [Cyanobacteria bacterium J06635_15]
MGQPLQAKLTLGEPNDQYEQEADRVAQDVVQRINTPQVDTPLGLPQNAPRDPLQRYPTETTAPLSPQLAPGAEPQVGRDITHEPLGIPAHVAQPLVLPQTPPSQIQADFESDLNAAKGGGSALEPGLRAKVEGAMGADFSGVKVHTAAAADQLNQAIQAKAFTTGQDVFFRRGAYEPGSRGGQSLIAHELTHVMQQNGAAVQRKSSLLSPRSAAEMTSASEADREIQTKGETNGTHTAAATHTNKTRLSDALKTGIEPLAGYSIDDVRGIYNLGKSTQLQTHSYRQKNTSNVTIQRFLDIKGYQRIDDESQIDGLVKQIAGNPLDRKIWPQLKAVILRQFNADTTHASLEAFFESLFTAIDNKEIVESLDSIDQKNFVQYDDDTYGFETTKHGDLQRDHKAGPRTITLGEDGLYHTNILSDHKTRTYALARGKYAFVKPCDEELIFGKHGHEHLAKDDDVEYAGEAFFRAGRLLFWTNNSGHYLPDPRAMEQAGLPMGKFVPLRFVDDKAIEAAVSHTKNPRKLAIMFGVTEHAIKAAFDRLGVRKRGGGTWL